MSSNSRMAMNTSNQWSSSKQSCYDYDEWNLVIAGNAVV
eukprot:CAMPEP_0170907910 /NCGR_PEP_ID=MMETSP0735-20130129/1603_1 /TAXON_ID=186038 /ORGANISM="Fragilariopsis kerguelensis, Strain L26-C5" /LENGTH=38 /DNA_ID= /DNA_START= /DNA_END= /DNA_ORIENTATION=